MQKSKTTTTTATKIEMKIAKILTSKSYKISKTFSQNTTVI